MIHCRGLLLLLLLLVVAGCAGRAAPVPQASHPLGGNAPGPVPSTSPANDRAGLSLDQIAPPPMLPASAPSTQPAGRPPVRAVRLFAKARIALLDSHPTEAAGLLEQAVALDPGSYELHQSLGGVYASSNDPRSLDQWQKAAAIEPDHLDLQIELGRELAARGDLPKAIEHFRLALQTTDYRQDDPAAGEVDFLLARALQEQGYDRASLEMYERLLSRLHNPQFAAQQNPQVAVLLAHPDVLALHIAALYERNHAYDAALSLLQAVAAQQPTNFLIHAQVVRDTAATGNRPQAIRGAADLVRRRHADPESLELLHEVAGDHAVVVLQQLHAQNPQDRDLLYALFDALRAQGRTPEADNLLTQAAQRWPDDLRLLRRQVTALQSGKDLSGAARLLIAAFARRPDHELELVPLWDSLSRPSPGGRLRLPDVQAIPASPGAEAARLVLLARSAQAALRPSVERDALRQAVDVRPIFPPAWRQALALIWSDDARTPEQKIDAARTLCDNAAKAGDAALAAELRGQSLLDQGRVEPAALAFAQAVKAGDRSPELCLNFATALHSLKDDKGAESLLWKVVSERPLYRDAYVELYALYEARDQVEEARRVLTTWLLADPDSITARRLEARDAFSEHRFVDARRILLDLFDRHDTEPEVLAAMEQFYSEVGRLDELTSVLRQRLATKPWNFTLATVLVETYERQQRVPQAIGVLDQMHTTAAGDPDLLYTLSGLYSRVGQTQQSEQTLREVLKLDPSYAGANNDLGYSWAERGENLGEAEGLIRKALQAEPDNASFLDSMGWVLYKRGKFDEALHDLARAADPAARADPAVLDHLGDTLYRLGEREQAAKRWRQAAQRLTEMHDDERSELKTLRLQLLKKQQQIDAGQPVNVAPVVGWR